MSLEGICCTLITVNGELMCLQGISFDSCYEVQESDKCARK